MKHFFFVIFFLEISSNFCFVAFESDEVGFSSFNFLFLLLWGFFLFKQKATNYFSQSTVKVGY
jgi:hypothetical protein